MVSPVSSRTTRLMRSSASTEADSRQVAASIPSIFMVLRQHPQGGIQEIICRVLQLTAPPFVTVWPWARQLLCNEYIADVDAIYSNRRKRSTVSVGSEGLQCPSVRIEQISQTSACLMRQCDFRGAATNSGAGLWGVKVPQAKVHSIQP